MEQKHGQQKERIAKFKSWKWNFFRSILNNKKKDMVRNTNIRWELVVDETNKNYIYAEEKRDDTNETSTYKMEKNDQEEDPEPGGWSKWEMI